MQDCFALKFILPAAAHTLHLEVFFQSRRVDDSNGFVAGSFLPFSVAIVLVYTVLGDDLLVKACHSGSQHSANQLCTST